MLPIEAITVWGERLYSSFTKMQIEDAPVSGEGVHRADDPYRALAYWRWEEPGGTTAIVARPWRRSSGFSATEKPSRTSPSPTPTAS
jgi:hypothetical protein